MRNMQRGRAQDFRCSPDGAAQAVDRFCFISAVCAGNTRRRAYFSVADTAQLRTAGSILDDLLIPTRSQID